MEQETEILDDADFEINDMDDALHKARILKKFAALIDEVEEMDAGNPKKRFIGHWFKKVKESVKKAAKKVGHFFKKTYNKAKDAIKKVSKNINFKKALGKLKGLIHSGMSVAACEKACIAGASAVLGPFAGFVGKVARPLCDAALSQLGKVIS